MSDNSIMYCFTQATGPFIGRPKAPELVRKTLDWPFPGQQGEFGETGEPEVALANGAIPRGVWGPYLPYDEAPYNGYI